MNEYRLTRNQMYPEGCMGFTDLSARQGHYIDAENAAEALEKMHQRYPDDWKGFTCVLWAENVERYELVQAEDTPT